MSLRIAKLPGRFAAAFLLAGVASPNSVRLLPDFGVGVCVCGSFRPAASSSISPRDLPPFGFVALSRVMPADSEQAANILRPAAMNRSIRNYISAWLLEHAYRP
jgi:hypothetical protein